MSKLNRKKKGLENDRIFEHTPDVWTVKMLADNLGIGKNKAYELINTNAIPSTRIGSKIVIFRPHVIDFLHRAGYNGRL